MSVLCDLHTHTTASDGQYTPTELVGLAKARGLSILAVTDHDTIAGVAEAQRAGNALGLTVIRGVELSAKDYPNCHILGYGFRDGDTELARLCEKFRAGRDDRKYKIVDFLHEKGVDIDLTEVKEIEGGEVIARPHFAQVMVKHGYVSTNREAFDRYLNTEEFRRRVKRFKADARACVEAIRAAGGEGVPGPPVSNGAAGRGAGGAGGAAQELGAGRYRMLLPQVHAGTAGILPPSGGKVPAPPGRRQRLPRRTGEARRGAGGTGFECRLAIRLNVL